MEERRITPAKKEYPATHSMETDWFGVDEDGNVALISFGQDGPVPDDIHDTYASDLTTEYLAQNDGPIQMLNYTKEQVQEIMKKSEPVDKDNCDFSDSSFIQIDVNKERQFINIIKSNKNYQPCYCLSKELGVYLVNLDEIKPRDKDALVNDRIVLRVYNYFTFINFDDKYDEDNDKENMANFPFYIYVQEDWISSIVHRMLIPKFPMKAEQYPKESQAKMLRFPFKFSEKNTFQIAKYFPCYLGRVDLILDNERYEILPNEDGFYSYYNDNGKQQLTIEEVMQLVRTCQVKKISFGGLSTVGQVDVRHFKLVDGVYKEGETSLNPEDVCQMIKNDFDKNHA